MGLFLSFVRMEKRLFQNLAFFSLIEPFYAKNKFFNFLACRAEKMCIFAPLIEKP